MTLSDLLTKYPEAKNLSLSIEFISNGKNEGYVRGFIMALMHAQQITPEQTKCLINQIDIASLK